VNRPSVEALRPDHRTGKFVPHATSQEKGKERSVEGGGGGAEQHTRQESRKENQKNSGKYSES
jgi:hypothetical protein